MDAYEFLRIVHDQGYIPYKEWANTYCEMKYDIVMAGVKTVARDLTPQEADHFLEDWENFEKGTFVVFPPDFTRKVENPVLSERYKGLDPLPFAKTLFPSAENIPDEVIDELPDEFFKYVTKPVSYNTTVRVFADEA